MANSLYTKARVAFLSAQIDVLTDDIRAALVTASYTPNIATDEFFDTVEAFVVGTPQTIGSVTITEDGEDAIVGGLTVTFTALTGDPVAAYVIYQHTGVAATSRLIAYSNTAAGLPLIPDGTNVPLVWSASGIFSWLGC